MPLTGDFAALRKMIGDLESCGTRVLAEATKAAKDAALEQYQADFASQRDPWGSGWKTSPHSMNLTGALANPRATSSGGVVRLTPERYWVFHQIGAHGMAKRAVLPFSASTWDPPIQAKIGDVVIGHFTPSP
jgi:hypothetical protein